MDKRNNNSEKVTNFRILITDDKTHKDIWTSRFTKGGLIAVAASIIVVLLIIFWCIVALTPLRTFIPGYPDEQSRHRAIQNAIRIDSLENEILQWSLYTENFKRIINGEEPIPLDSLIKAGADSAGRQIDLQDFRSKDSLLRASVNEEEQFELSTAVRNLPIEGMHFFVPLKGMISQEYDMALHPAVDITAPANSMVMAVLDGTVISAGWDDDTGYTIQVQHAGDIISIYRHNQKLLKKAGDKVSAGSPIAVVGNTGTLSTGDHLHFELWYKGEAVDPAKYINF